MSEYVNPSNASVEITKLIQQHERTVQKADNTHAQEMEKLRNTHDEKEQRIEQGWIGIVFGGEKNASKNITAFLNICLLLGATIVSLCVYCSEQDKAFVKAIWSGVLPILTLSLGYLFGKK